MHITKEKKMKVKIRWYQYFGLGSFIAGWIAKSVVDGVISRAEIEELVQGCLDMLGISEIKIED